MHIRICIDNLVSRYLQGLFQIPHAKDLHRIVLVIPDYHLLTSIRNADQTQQEHRKTNVLKISHHFSFSKRLIALP